MPAPKDPTRLKRAKSGPLKMECYTCRPAPGASRPAIYASRGQIAEHGAPRCAECGGAFTFADVDVCAAIQPDELENHPVHRDRCTRELAAATRDEREHPMLECHECQMPAPRGSRAEEWYCPRCSYVNTLMADGTRTAVKVRARGADAEGARYRESYASPELERIHYPRNRRVEIAPARPWREALEERDERGDAPAGGAPDDLPF